MAVSKVPIANLGNGKSKEEVYNYEKNLQPLAGQLGATRILALRKMGMAAYRARIDDMCRHIAKRKASYSQIPTVLPASYASLSGDEPTLKYQESLPKFPVPPLHQTLEKYLRQYRPHVSDEEYERTKKVVEKFGMPGGTGELLQQRLEERRDKRENWLIEWWRNFYLKQRFPNVLHTAPGSLLQPQPFRGVDQQIEWMSFRIAAFASAISLLATHRFPPAMVNGRPLCMDEYYRSLCSCRVPGRPKDSIFYHPIDSPDAPRHVIVMRKNHFFKFDILDEQKHPISPAAVHRQLKRVVRESQVPAIPVGLLTSLGRDAWADLYERLKQVPTNAESLLAIQSSTFVACLDETEDIRDASARNRHDLRWGICGGGSTQHSGNRWFDKSFLFHAGTNGESGVYGDHTVADGVMVSAFMAHVSEYMKSLGSDAHQESFDPGSLAPPQELQFSLGDDILQDIENAGRHIDRILDRYQIEERPFTLFGKTPLKGYGLHPDGCVQIALQLAYWRMFGRLPVVYEAISLQGFRLGRVDHLRPVTVESAEFVRAFDDGNVEASEKLSKLRTALQVHVRNTSEIKQGRGMEKHLFGLLHIAKENDIDASGFFDDPSWEKASKIDFRTATLPGGLVKANLFPVRPQPNTTGLSYSILEDHIDICINNAEMESILNLDQFIEALHLSLGDIRDIAEAALFEESKL